MKPANLKSDFQSEIHMSKAILRRLVLALVLLVWIAYPLSGIYVVRVNETAVLKRFGRIIDARIAPGLHYAFPWPVDAVTKIPTGEIRRFQAGFGAEPEEVKAFEARYGRVSENPLGSFLVPYCITGDKNIIHMKVIVQYRIDDPRAYLVACQEPETVVRQCLQSAILRTFSCADVDAALTTGRVALQQRILDNLHEQLSSLTTGITVFSTEIKSARPPSDVAGAFKDVINAREEHRTMVHDANAYRNQAIPEGKAEAARLVNEAEAYKRKKIAHAEGEAQRFAMLAAEYAKDKATTSERLYLEAVSEVLPTVQKIIIDSDQGGDVTNLRFFTQGSE
ncbi:MAG: FtsH protease activity modulator HflK [Candidatus Abyssubacteria bacterium]